MTRRTELVPLGRSTGHRQKRSRILIVGSGEVTEAQYAELLNSQAKDVVINYLHCPLDPEALARWAKKKVREEKRACRAKPSGSSEGYAHVFVVVDVDGFPIENLRAASAICKGAGMNLVISNPCFEAWLIDHVEICPESISTTKLCEERAKNLGLVNGRDNKNIVSERLLGGMREKAVNNARGHENARKEAIRKDLSCTDFGPWTDMPVVIESIFATNLTAREA